MINKKKNFEDSIEYLDKNSISYSLLKPTNTALEKSIIDAVYSLRKYYNQY